MGHVIVETRQGIGIQYVPNKNDEDEYEYLERKIGSDNLIDVRTPTLKDCMWIKAMGGYVPEHLIEELKEKNND